MLFDKTGTLTRGKPELTDVQVLPGMQEDVFLWLVAQAEQGSEHPLASAIVAGVRARGIDLRGVPVSVQALPGRGIEARVEAHAVLVGTRRLFEERGLGYAALREQMETLEGQGKTVMLVACDGDVAGLLAVADRIKVGSAQAVRALQQQGIEAMLLTGDNTHTALALAEQVGIAADHVIAEVLPQDKVREVVSWQKRGLAVAFVGDGINDAPALAQADVGIAMGTGTDIAMEAADATLVKGNLKSVVTALALARATMHVIRQNLFWAFGYNVLLIPTAILSPFIPLVGQQMPVFAAAAMALSSVAVVSNSLRLRFFRSPQETAEGHSSLLLRAKEWAPLLVGLAIVLLTLLTIIAGTLRSTTARPASSQSTGVSHQFVASRPTADGRMHVTLTLSPYHLGPNVFRVSVLDQSGATETIQSVKLATTMLDMDMGTDVITLSPDGHGHFTGSGSLSMTGDWRISVIIHTTDHTLHTATFNLSGQR
jgi:magnesium-transporting ATPase (P-type)